MSQCHDRTVDQMRLVRHKPSRKGNFVDSAPLAIAILVGGLAGFTLDLPWWGASLIATAVYCVLLLVTRLLNHAHERLAPRKQVET